jgi:hypothetical protein
MNDHIETIIETNIESTCRICRQGSQIEGKEPSPLISPCLCEDQKNMFIKVV